MQVSLVDVLNGGLYSLDDLGWVLGGGLTVSFVVNHASEGLEDALTGMLLGRNRLK